jgi:hypothetical protein
MWQDAIEQIKNLKLNNKYNIEEIKAGTQGLNSSIKFIFHGRHIDVIFTGIKCMIRDTNAGKILHEFDPSQEEEIMPVLMKILDG